MKTEFQVWAWDEIGPFAGFFLHKTFDTFEEAKTESMGFEKVRHHIRKVMTEIVHEETGRPVHYHNGMSVPYGILVCDYDGPSYNDIRTVFQWEVIAPDSSSIYKAWNREKCQKVVKDLTEKWYLAHPDERPLTTPPT